MKTPQVNGVECPECGSMDARVKFSGHTLDGTRVRQRWCSECGGRFTTAEIVLDGQSYHSLTYKRQGRPVWERGQFEREVTPDEIQTTLLVDGSIIVRVQPGERRGRQLCRRGLHELIVGVTTTESKPKQCMACRNGSHKRFQDKAKSASAQEELVA